MRIRSSFVTVFAIAAAVVFPAAYASPAAAATDEGSCDHRRRHVRRRRNRGRVLRATRGAAPCRRLPAVHLRPARRGLGDIADTSQALNAFADSVRAQTGAARVDLIGHSQGGLVGRYYIKYLGGASEVDSMISLGAPHYGTSLANLATLLGLGSCLGVDRLPADGDRFVVPRQPRCR